MDLMTLDDPREIEKLLGGNRALHVYELGDLDDFFWPSTAWYANPNPQAVALLYAGRTLML